MPNPITTEPESGTAAARPEPGPAMTAHVPVHPSASLSSPVATDPTMERADPRRYLGMLLSRWWIILLIGLLGTAAGAVHCILAVPLYRATARYEIVAEPRLGPNNQSYAPDYIKMRNRQVLILAGGNLRGQVSAKLKPRWASVVSDIKVSVGVRPVREIETMIDISVDAVSAEYALEYLKELLKSYQEFARAKALEANQIALRNLWTEKQQLANELEDAQNALLKFQAEHNIRFSEAKQQIDDQFLASLVQRQNVLRMERTMMETQFPRIQDANAATIQDVLQLTMETHQATIPGGRYTGPTTSPAPGGAAPAPAAASGTGVGMVTAATGGASLPGVGETSSWQQLEENVARLEADYQDNLAIFKPSHPRMKQMQRYIDAAKRELRFSADSGLRRMKARYEALKLQEAALEEAARTWRGEMSLSVADRAAYDNLRSKVDHLKQLHDQVFTRIIDNSSQSADTMMSHEIEPPSKLDNIVWPDRTKIMTFSILAALALGIAFVFFLDFLDTTLMDVMAIEERMGLQYLSSIPNWERILPALSIKNAQVIVKQEKTNIPSEAYRSLRTSLDNIIANRNGYALGITSTDADEGKSMTALNLAVTFSWTGRKVLLVDGDLRRGKLHEPFKLDGKVGFSDLLQNKVADWHTVVQPTAYDNLSLIPVGPYISSAPELLDPGRIKLLIQEWGAEYNIIIFDTAPIGRVVDTALIGRACDGVLLVARHGQSTFAGVRHAVHRLQGAHLVGFCLNGIEVGGRQFGYFNYYGYFRRFARYGHYAYTGYYDRYRYGQYGYAASNKDGDDRKKPGKPDAAPPPA